METVRSSGRCSFSLMEIFIQNKNATRSNFSDDLSINITDATIVKSPIAANDVTFIENKGNSNSHSIERLTGKTLKRVQANGYFRESAKHQQKKGQKLFSC